MERRHRNRIDRTTRMLLVAGLLAALVTAAGAGRLPSVLGDLQSAVLNGDHQALAALVHHDGVQLSFGADTEHAGELTRDQAHYYFRNLLRSRRTLRFEFEKQPPPTETHLHAVAVWRYERAGDGRTETSRILFSFVRGAGGWRVYEITALRGG